MSASVWSASARRYIAVAASGLLLSAGLVAAAAERAGADTQGPIDFESYSTGTVDLQDGWSSFGAAGHGCGVYDHTIVDNSTLPNGAPASFGAQSLRISNAVMTGCFSDQTFSKPTVDAAGEATASAGTFPSGTRQPHFRASFDLASVDPATVQPGLSMSVSPDRGEGARMSYVRIADSPAGWNMFFDDYRDVAPLGSSGNLADGCSGGDHFTDTQFATGLDRSVPHSLQFDLTLLPGPHNDVVTISLDGQVVATGTTWEDYDRYCQAADQSTTVRTLLFRTGSNSSSGVPSVAGAGFLIDNVEVASGLAPTSLTYTGDTSATEGHFATLSASLTGSPGVVPIEGQLVSFTLGSGLSAQTVSATTDASGIATTTALVPHQDAGTVPLSVSFTGDATYIGSSTNPTMSMSKASTSLALTAPPAFFASSVSPALSLSATLTTPVVTDASSSSAPVVGRAVSFVLCPQPSGSCFTLNGSLTDANGLSTVSSAFAHPVGRYSISATFDGSTDPRYDGATSSVSTMLAVNWATRVVTTTSGGQYRGAIVVSAHMDFGFLFGKYAPTAGKLVSFYLMPSPSSTNIGAGHLIGTAITGSSGNASIAYKMNALAFPPLPGSTLAFAAKYSGSSDMAFGPSQSPTVGRLIVKRAVSNALAATRVGSTLNGTANLKEANLTYAIVSNGVSSTVSIAGAALPAATDVVQWFTNSDVFGASFPVVTGANGIAPFSKPIPGYAAKVRAAYGATAKYTSGISNVVPF